MVVASNHAEDINPLHNWASTNTLKIFFHNAGYLIFYSLLTWPAMTNKGTELTTDKNMSREFVLELETTQELNGAALPFHKLRPLAQGERGLSLSYLVAVWPGPASALSHTWAQPGDAEWRPLAYFLDGNVVCWKAPQFLRAYPKVDVWWVSILLLSQELLI